MSAPEITFLEEGAAPPTATRVTDGGSTYQIVELLKAHPGRWAKVATYADDKRSSASAAVSRLKRAGCQATSRSVRNDAGEATATDVWARYGAGEVTVTNGTGTDAATETASKKK